MMSPAAPRKLRRVAWHGGANRRKHRPAGPLSAIHRVVLSIHRLGCISDAGPAYAPA